MNIPNIITSFRLILVPFFVISFLSDIPNGKLIAGIIFAIAGISDVADGYIARKYNMVSRLGEALDPLADKLMQMSAAICLFSKDIINVYFTFAFIIKEVCMILMATILATKIKRVIPAQWYGKFATFLFMLVVFISITFTLNKSVIFYMFLAGLIAEFFALFNYIRLYFKYRTKSEKEF